MTEFRKSGRTALHRIPKLGSHDREVIHGVIDRAMLAHVGFIQDGVPVVIPTLHGREGDTLYFHGSRQSRLMESLASGHEVCAAFTVLKGFVMARSAFSHSAQYESVVAYGTGCEIVEKDQKLRALKAISDHLYPGRWEDVRPPSTAELAATSIVTVAISDASAKISLGGPEDRPDDMGWPAWAGVIPAATRFGPPVQDPAQDKSMSFPEYLTPLL